MSQYILFASTSIEEPAGLTRDLIGIFDTVEDAKAHVDLFNSDSESYQQYDWSEIVSIEDKRLIYHDIYGPLIDKVHRYGWQSAIASEDRHWYFDHERLNNERELVTDAEERGL